MFWRRRKKSPPKNAAARVIAPAAVSPAGIVQPTACPNGEHKEQETTPTTEMQETTEEITGIHERTMDVLRGSRQTLQELIAQLDDIKKQAERIVHSGDLPGDQKKGTT